VTTFIETQKYINNLCKREYISVAVYCCNRCERKRKWSFEVSD